jgi:hypothetical protein
LMKTGNTAPSDLGTDTDLLFSHSLDLGPGIEVFNSTELAFVVVMVHPLLLCTRGLAGIPTSA